MGSADSDTMRAFIIAALAAVVAGDAKPYTVGQVLAGATHGGVITSTTYHGGLKVAGFLTLLPLLSLRLLATLPLLCTARGRLSPTLLDRFLPDTLLVVSSPPPPMPEDSR